MNEFEFLLIERNKITSMIDDVAKNMLRTFHRCGVDHLDYEVRGHSGNYWLYCKQYNLYDGGTVETIVNARYKINTDMTLIKEEQK